MTPSTIASTTRRVTPEQIATLRALRPGQRIAVVQTVRVGSPKLDNTRPLSDDNNNLNAPFARRSPVPFGEDKQALTNAACAVRNHCSRASPVSGWCVRPASKTIWLKKRHCRMKR